jgi:hypothetical protein
MMPKYRESRWDIFGMSQNHSHSIVPGGFEVTS